MKDEITWAANDTELAVILGVARRTVIRWSKIDGCPQPQADGRQNVPAWRKWIAENGLKGGETSELEALKIRRLTAQCQAEEYDLKVRTGEYVAWAELEPQVTEAHAQITAIVRQKLENEFPALVVGRDIPAIRGECERVVDAILNELRGEMDGLHGKYK